MQLSAVPTWDVAALLTYAFLRTHAGIEHAWEIVIVVAFGCCLDRDMEIHECIAALYMLRYSCHTIQLDSALSYILCVVVTTMSYCARLEHYQLQKHQVRRTAVGIATFLAVLVKYKWNENHVFSIVRLTFFVCTTRLSVSDYSMDSWDAALQSLWLFVVPIYFYSFLVVHGAIKYYSHLKLYQKQSQSVACLV